MGQSYLGATQYLLAPTRPPHLRASFPASAPADFHQCWVYHSGGAFELGWQIPYAILMARDTIARRGLTPTLLPQLEGLLVAAVTPWAPPLSPEAYQQDLPQDRHFVRRAVLPISPCAHGVPPVGRITLRPGKELQFQLRQDTKTSTGKIQRFKLREG